MSNCCIVLAESCVSVLVSNLHSVTECVQHGRVPRTQCGSELAAQCDRVPAPHRDSVPAAHHHSVRATLRDKTCAAQHDKGPTAQCHKMPAALCDIVPLRSATTGCLQQTVRTCTGVDTLPLYPVLMHRDSSTPGLPSANEPNAARGRRCLGSGGQQSVKGCGGSHGAPGAPRMESGA